MVIILSPIDNDCKGRKIGLSTMHSYYSSITSNVWSYGLCDCFSDITVCLITWVLPCYMTGRVARGVGESCLLHGVCFISVVKPQSEEKSRNRKKVKEILLPTLIYHLCCSVCALLQEYREINDSQVTSLLQTNESPGSIIYGGP